MRRFPISPQLGHLAPAFRFASIVLSHLLSSVVHVANRVS